MTTSSSQHPQPFSPSPVALIPLHAHKANSTLGRKLWDRGPRVFSVWLTRLRQLERGRACLQAYRLLWNLPSVAPTQAASVSPGGSLFIHHLRSPRLPESESALTKIPNECVCLFKVRRHWFRLFSRAPDGSTLPLPPKGFQGRLLLFFPLPPLQT